MFILLFIKQKHAGYWPYLKYVGCLICCIFLGVTNIPTLKKCLNALYLPSSIPLR